MIQADTTASFGYWIRRRRQALDLTQAELARRVGCATVTVSKLERDERRPSRQMAELLAEHLAVPEEQRARFLAAALGERAVDALPLSSRPIHSPAPEPPPTPQPNVPSLLAPSILRVRDEESLLALLENPAIRLVTITGPGGVGKTHLSLRMAERAAGHFRDGAAFVALDATRNPEQVLTTLASALSVRESAGQGLRESLLTALSHRRQLLVLDNFEQVLAAAELVNALVRACPHLKILITSRERLGLTAEQLFPLKPLAVPASDGAAAALSRNPAVQLFTLRAQAVQPDFVLDDATAPTVAAICAALDGLPLAIELAAARLALFSLPSLLRELTGDEQSPLRLLRSQLRDAPRRHRSLTDAVQWSYELLTDDEQRLFRRLSVFVGSFPLDAAQAIAGDGDDILEGVHSLVAKSLLVPRPQEDGSTRFAYLQTIRDFASEQLIGQGDEQKVYSAHARWYTALTTEAEDQIIGPGQLAWLDRLSAEADNIHAAIGWSIDNGEVDLALTFGETLAMFWWIGNQLGAGRYWLRRLLPLLQSEIPLIRQAKIRFNAGLIEQLQGDYVESVRLYEVALTQAQASGSHRTEAAIRCQLGWIGTWQQTIDDAIKHYETSIRLCKEHNFGWNLALTQANLSLCRARIGQVDKALQLAHSSFEKFREIGDRWGMSWALHQIAMNLIRQGKFAEASNYAEESYSHIRLHKDKLAIAWSLSSLGRIAFEQKEFDDARRHWLERLKLRWNVGDIHGVVGGIAELATVDIECGLSYRAVILARIVHREGARMGASAGGTEWIRSDAILDKTRSLLSPEEYAAAWAEGEARSLADVVEELLHPNEVVEQEGSTE